VKRVLPWILGVVILTAVVAVGLSQAGEKTAEAPDEGTSSFDLATAKRQLAGAPAPLAKLHDQSSQLIGGGVPAFKQRLAQLEGNPVVINKWASWCGPCRSEFPAFQQVATERGKEIAFLGVNAHDAEKAARDFLIEYPIPFPSYLDPDEKIAREIKAPANYPITVFVDAKGDTAFIHQGGYTSAAALRKDIDQYLG
jgi:cytochrome c biogenesis protein CcmG, thiol:disulfide interchange protein DsbE